MAVTEEDARYRMVATITRLETKLDALQQCVEDLIKRITVVEGDCIRRSALWSVAIILSTLFSGAFATYYAKTTTIQTTQDKVTDQQTTLHDELKHLEETSEMNRKALETWMKQNAKSH